MRNLITRSITGAFFVAVLIGAILWSPFAAGLLFLIATIVGSHEFYTLIDLRGSLFPLKKLGILTNSILFILVFLISTNLIPWEFSAVILLPVALIPITELFSASDNPFGNIAITLMGLFYIAIPFSLLFGLALYPDFDLKTGYQPELLLGFFFILWTNDTGAYVTGSLLGRKKFFERISPKKTWEGTIGGIVLSLIVAYLIALYFDELSLTNWIVIALITSILATLGDLVESMFKRSLGVKDSGKILPGHGGILDRFDGALLAAPIVFMYILLFC